MLDKTFFYKYKKNLNFWLVKCNILLKQVVYNGQTLYMWRFCYHHSENILNLETGDQRNFTDKSVLQSHLPCYYN